MQKVAKLVKKLATAVIEERLGPISKNSVIDWDNTSKETIDLIKAQDSTRLQFQLLLSELDKKDIHVKIVPLYDKVKRSNGTWRYKYRYEISVNYRTLVSKRSRNGCKGYILRELYSKQFPELYKNALTAINGEKSINQEKVQS